MKRSKILLFAGVLLPIFSFSQQKKDIKSIAIGVKMPMQLAKFMDVSGDSVLLREEMGKRGLLVVFSGHTCPCVVGAPPSFEGWEKRYELVRKHAKKNKVGLVMLNSSTGNRDGADSFESMQARAKEQAYTWPYLYDAGHKLADAFGAKATPHLFLFNEDFELVYKGDVDDDAKTMDSVKVFYIKDAMEALSNGETPPIAVTKTHGCSIKRVKRKRKKRS